MGIEGSEGKKRGLRWKGGKEVERSKKKELVLVSNMNGVVKELQQQVSWKPSSLLASSSVADGREPQLSNPTKERVKGPVGRRLPTKKAQGTKAIPEEDEEDVSAALREFRTAAKRVREARESDEKDEVDKNGKHEVSDMSRQGIVDPADFDRAWFFRVPSFSCLSTTTKSEPTELFCENNNMSSNNNNNNNNNNRDSVVTHNSTNEEVGLD